MILFAMLRAVLILSFILVTASGGSFTYSVAVIPPPSGYVNVTMSGINNSGQVTGNGNSGGPNPQPFIASVAGNAAIPVPPGLASASVQGLNNAGQVVGYASYGSNSPNDTIFPAFIGTPSGSVVIPLPAGWSSVAGLAINDSGVVTGNGGYGGTQAYIGTTSGSVPIPLLPGYTEGWGYGINASGQVAGFDSNQFGSGPLAFIGTSVGSIAVPLPAGWFTSIAYAINSTAQVAGWGDNALDHNQAFIGSASSSMAIPLPPGATDALVNEGAMNDSGMVVGSSTAGSTNIGGWIWDAANGTVLLNTLVPAGWNVASALSISNNGHILAQASFSGGPLQYVDLFPTGSPSSPTLSYPENGLTAVPTTTTLSWQTAIGATSYDVYFGTSPSPLLVMNVTTSSYTPAALAPGTTYYWQVIARNSVGTTGSAISTFTTLSAGCSFSASPSPISITSVGGVQSVGVTAGAGCSWTATSTAPWLALLFASGTGNGSIQMDTNVNQGTARLGYIHFANQTVGVMQGGSPSAAIFNDVSAADPYFDYVSLMSTYGITAGCQASPALYCPGSPATRAEMAVFVVRGLDLALGTAFTYPATAYFQDITATGADSEFYPYVQKIAQLGITAGCQSSPPLFCPDSSITQAEMAVFMIRAWMLANNLTAFTYPQTPYFTDVPASNEFFPFVQKMVQLGFWQGCTSTTYCQADPVTRDQMAPMILRSMLGTP